MTSYQLKNSTDKAIGFTLVRKDSKNGKESVIKEDMSLYPGQMLDMPKFGGAHIDFHAPVDFTFRQKKAISEKFTFISKTVKETKENVTAVDLPVHFSILKIKKVHA